MMSDNKTLKELKKSEAPKPLEDFVGEEYNMLVEDLNSLLRRLSFTRNFDSHIIKDITLVASATTRVEHNLGVIPSYRLILKQVGGDLITDGEFTKKYIELVNAGGADAVVTVAIFKE